MTNSKVIAIGVNCWHAQGNWFLRSHVQGSHKQAFDVHLSAMTDHLGAISWIP